MILKKGMQLEEKLMKSLAILAIFSGIYSLTGRAIEVHYILLIISIWIIFVIYWHSMELFQKVIDFFQTMKIDIKFIKEKIQYLTEGEKNDKE